MARQAINVGFPNPNYVSETDGHQAILPGVYVSETEPTILSLNARITTASALRMGSAAQTHLSGRATTKCSARAAGAFQARLSAKGETAARARVSVAPNEPLFGRINAGVHASLAPAGLSAHVAGKLTTRTAAHAVFVASFLTGRISTQSKIRLNRAALSTALSGRIAEHTSLRATKPLLNPVFVSGRISTKPHARGTFVKQFRLFGHLKHVVKAKAGGDDRKRPIEGTPLLRELGDPDPLWVAIEVDLWDTTTASIKTLLLSNRGPLTRTINGVLRQYEPRLRVPILLGTTLSSDFYNQPLRGQPNAGTIVFAIEADFKAEGWFDDNIHWLGRTFRVYEGRTLSEVGVDVDGSALSLIYTGHVDGLTFDLSPSDGQAATIITTDASSDLNKSIVDDLYPSDYPIVSLQGKPRPQLWGGRAFSIDPVLEDQANLIYRVSRLACTIIEVRVGGIPWRQSAGTPLQGEWQDLGDGSFKLGAVTGGAEVRVDAQVGDFMAFDTAAAFETICAFAGVPVDPAAMAQLRLDWPPPIWFYTDTNPILGLDALDQIAVGNTCWWAFGADGAVIAGLIKTPDPIADYVMVGSDPRVPLDITLIPATAIDPLPKEIAQLDLGAQTGSTAGGGLLPPAWRVRVEYERRFNPATQFLGGATDEEKQLQGVPGLVADWPDPFGPSVTFTVPLPNPFNLVPPPTTTVTVPIPIYSLSPADGTNIRQADPRADDIYIKSLVWQPQDAHTLRLNLIRGITGPNVRRLFDLYGWIPNNQIKLFQTIYFVWQDNSRTNPAIYNGYFRVLSAIYSIGGGPSQLQLWGNVGAIPGSGPVPTTPPPSTPVGIGLDTGVQAANAGDPITGVRVLMSDGSAFAGTLAFVPPNGNDGGNLIFVTQPNFGPFIFLNVDVPHVVVTVHNYTVAATQNGVTIVQNGSFQTPAP